MKNIKTLALMAAAVPALTACLDNEDNSYAGFTGLTTSGTVYANSDRGGLAFMSYGPWRMEQNSGSDWCKVETKEGQGMAIYTIPVLYSPNTTGEYRYAQFRLVDKDNSEAYALFNLAQYATRGDGSFGAARLVSEINGDDGSRITFAYDNLCRLQTLRVTKQGVVDTKIDVSFSNTDSLITVRANGGEAMEGAYDIGFQTERLRNSTDTVEYNDNGILNQGKAYNLEHRMRGGANQVYAFLLESNPANPDAELKFDSVRYQRRATDGTLERSFMKWELSDADNRYQSVDVNQLILGVEHCNPYVLAGLFRLTRCSRVVKEASTKDGKYEVAAELNSDKSVKRLTVKGIDGTTVNYDFTYNTQQ